ncbi:hypothetical protein AV274_0376 [Blastocystis sp. ATCC 50177/Nand II]|uniref:Uncharacterized protein n=1 Tax=Blastocystis sp. subtype 1 (strain ATCC 50177 / NandII) TaxID=478820 RepID=A0A196SLI9_BLAHN|nr:hypothetical protein AV274_0376 [Blastocystis sp. ATCC 50177/Nand II]
MEIQIASTLQLLSESAKDKNVQIHGLKFLVETCADGVSDESIRELPIVKTVVTSMQTNSTVKQVLKLGCSVLIKYSRFPCCVEEFYSLNVVPYLCTQITRLASESVLSMELAVIAAYGMNMHKRPGDVDATVLTALLKIEGKWDTNPGVLQQILTNYAVLAQNEPNHPAVLSSQLVSSLEKYLHNYRENEYRRGAASCAPSTSSMSSSPSCCSACRDEVIHHEGIALLVRLTNLSQYDEAVCCEAMKVIRCVCSAETQSLQSVIDGNVMSSAVMCMSSYPRSREIIAHGVRALEWVVHAGTQDVWKLMVDEGVGDVIVQALVDHDDDEILAFLASLTVQLLQAMRDPTAIAAFVQTINLLPAVREAMARNAQNESILASLAKILAVLASTKPVLPLLVQADFCPVLLLSLHHVQLPATVRLLTAVLWKACLDQAGRVAVFQAGGVDALIEMLQNFPNDATVLRNCSGCLLLLTRDYAAVGQTMMSRLALSPVIDALQQFAQEPQLVIQAMPLLQVVCAQNARARHYAVDHDAFAAVMEVMQKQMSNEPVIHCSLSFLLLLLGTEDGIRKARSETNIIPILSEVETYYKANLNVFGIVSTIKVRLQSGAM